MKKIDRLWAGVFGHMAAYSLLQDAYGMERYIEVVRATWVPALITVPVAIGVILLVVLKMEDRPSKGYKITVTNGRVDLEDEEHAKRTEAP